MGPLVCTREQLRAHRNDLLGALRGSLPETNGRYVVRASSDDTEANLVAEASAPPEYAMRRGGVPVPVVPLLDATPSRPSPYWLAWHEGWRSPQPRRGERPRKNSLQFRTSSVSVYFGAPGSPKRQVIRGEWAGTEISATGELAFQGRGAAHPHWHYAGLEGSGPDEISAVSTLAAVLSKPDETIDFEPSPTPPGDRDETLPWTVPAQDAVWASIHLAASARWAQDEWQGPQGPGTPHAFDPADCAEVRRWIASCIRYLQSELQGQLLRQR